MDLYRIDYLGRNTTNSFEFKTQDVSENITDRICQVSRA